MTPKTLGELKPQLARVAGVSGMKVNDSRLLTRINEALELLWDHESVADTYWRYLVELEGDRLALPYELDMIEKACLSKHKISVMSKWYEFVSSGPGIQEGDNKDAIVLIDRGLDCVARQPDGTELKVRLYATRDERVNGVRPKAVVTGYDENGKWIRTQDASGSWIDGEELSLNGDLEDNWSETVNYFSHVSSIIKPETNGEVQVFYHHAATDTNYVGGDIPWHVQTSAFRTYSLPANEGLTSTVEAYCRRRLIPVKHDNDVMPISNYLALKHAILAIQYQESVGAKEDAEYHERKAFQHLSRHVKVHEAPANPVRDQQEMTWFDEDYMDHMR